MINANYANYMNSFNRYKQQQYSKVYQHELDHKTAAGSLAGPIVIEKDANGVATGGHVEIKMPALNEKNPDETIKDAKTVINSALASDEPSTQDLKVAEEARGILTEAKDIKDSSNDEDNEDDDEENKPAGQKLNIVA